MAATQEQESPFLELPAELRNEVYELVFLTEGPIDLDDKKTRTIEPPLLQVCRQIRGEARQLYQCHAMYQTDRTATAARLLKKISRQELALFKGLNIRAPQGDREQDGDGAEIEEEYAHCLRKTRRTLLAFDQQFARKGLKRGMVRMQMLVLDEQANKKRLEWVTSANIGDFKTQGRTGRRRRGKARTVRKKKEGE